LPSLRDFDIVSWSQSEQVSFQFSGGQPSFRRIVVYSIALFLHRQGKALIEPANVQYRGKRYQTQAMSIRVLLPGQGAQQKRSRPTSPDPMDLFAQGTLGDEQPEADPFRGLHAGSKDVLLRATVDTEHPFVGQQVTYSL